MSSVKHRGSEFMGGGLRAAAGVPAGSPLMRPPHAPTTRHGRGNVARHGSDAQPGTAGMLPHQGTAEGCSHIKARQRDAPASRHGRGMLPQQGMAGMLPQQGTAGTRGCARAPGLPTSAIAACHHKHTAKGAAASAHACYCWPGCAGPLRGCRVLRARDCALLRAPDQGHVRGHRAVPVPGSGGGCCGCVRPQVCRVCGLEPG